MPGDEPADAGVSVEDRDGRTALAFTGRLDAAGAGRLWHKVYDALHDARGGPVLLDVSGVSLIDTAGATFLLGIESGYRGEATLEGLEPRFEAILTRVRAAIAPPPAPVPPSPFQLWDWLRAVMGIALDGVAFLGETVVALATFPRRRRMLRGRDLLRYADQAGVRALPLVLLLGFLIGLILAFQSAVPMRRFGADIYVANLVAISLLRELGPLLAAVILAGRTGSAFAAEIGTMKVNEEVDALVTMGLDPMTMLILPRLLAAMLVMPVMTLVMDVAGLAGMTVVMMGFGFPPVTIANQVARAATVMDLAQGLFKAFCFGAVVAAIGCRQGLNTGVGPRAVGQSATGAVVGGIVATILLDGMFALLLYQVGL